MASPQRLVPEIRFEGFSDEWRQCKAKELCSIGTGKSNTQDQAEDGRYPFYIRSDVPVRSNKYLYDCEAVITIGDGNIGKVFHYVDGKFDLHQRCYKMTGFRDIWGKYFFYYFSTKFYDRAMKMTAKATVDSVRLEMISEMDIQKPAQISEQKQIAEYFASLDNLIVFYQRKYDRLKNVKKSMLEKMFPRNGANVPEIRFTGFTDAWEQRKLEDILQTLPFKAYLKIPEQDGKYEIIQQGNDPIIGYASGEPCKDYENAVIFGDHTLSLYKPRSPFFVATDGVRIIKGFDNMDGNYLLSLLERNKPQSEGYKRYYSILADIDVFFTKNHEEQSKIGEYFSRIDHLITLHQRKYEKLEQIKKSLLQKMFV